MSLSPPPRFLHVLLQTMIPPEGDAAPEALMKTATTTWLPLVGEVSHQRPPRRWQFSSREAQEGQEHLAAVSPELSVVGRKEELHIPLQVQVATEAGQELDVA